MLVPVPARQNDSYQLELSGFGAPWDCPINGVLDAHIPPVLSFFLETRQGSKYVKNLRWRLGLWNCISHVGKGKGAGIALFYDEKVKIKKVVVGPRYIDVLI